MGVFFEKDNVRECVDIYPNGTISYEGVGPYAYLAAIEGLLLLRRLPAFVCRNPSGATHLHDARFQTLTGICE